MALLVHGTRTDLLMRQSCCIGRIRRHGNRMAESRVCGYGGYPRENQSLCSEGGRRVIILSEIFEAAFIDRRRDISEFHLCTVMSRSG